MFLSPGEKILNLRKKYKITQMELSEGVISRTSLGMIETGKRSMSQELARQLCENISKILKERGVRDRINITEILKSKETKALEYLEETVSGKGGPLKKRIWDADEGLFVVSPEKKFHYAKKLYELFLAENDIPNARKYLLLSLHYVASAPSTEGVAAQLEDLFRMDAALGEYEEIVRIFEDFRELLYETQPHSQALLRLKLAYAEALARGPRGNEAVEFLKYNMKKAKADAEFFLYRKHLANLYNIQNKYEEAVAEYTSLAKGKSQEVKAALYSYVLEIGFEIGEEDIVRKYFNRTRDIFEETEFAQGEDYFHVAAVLGKCSMYLNNMEKAREYMQKALKAGKEIPGTEESRLQLIRFLFEIYEVRDFDNVKKTEDEYAQLLEVRKDYRPAISVLNFYKKWMPIELEKKFREYK
ncbi:MAG: helix-turn-helix domain-containing protein [Fusobacteriaceae bacterium]|jgi:tetratricopeptide (TPR) repeat protein|nr:helix-turn-helix domain-containing protein [Fusobacteriaceae bacterium]